MIGKTAGHKEQPVLQVLVTDFFLNGATTFILKLEKKVWETKMRNIRFSKGKRFSNN